MAYLRSGVQGTAGVTTYATLYQVPSGKTAVVSTIAVCNTATAARTYRIGFAASATTPAAADQLIMDASVPASDTTFLSLGITLQAGQFVRVSSSAADVTFQIFVSEI